jgi:hypothetical protein
VWAGAASDLSDLLSRPAALKALARPEAHGAEAPAVMLAAMAMFAVHNAERGNAGGAAPG